MVCFSPGEPPPRGVYVEIAVITFYMFVLSMLVGLPGDSAMAYVVTLNGLGPTALTTYANGDSECYDGDALNL